MRLTTKIILSIIMSIFLISLTFIIGFSFTDRKNYNHSNVASIDLPQDNMTGIELPSLKTILIDEIPFESNNHLYGITDKCSIFFDSIPANSSPGMLFIPSVLKDYISFNASNDTLTVKLNLRDLGNKYRSDEYAFHSISGVNLYFTISNLDIISNIQLIPVNIKNIDTDSIKINSRGDIWIDSCKVQLIDPRIMDNYRSLKVTNCNIKRITIDMDNIRNWNIENCVVEEEFFTGSERHNMFLHRNDSGTKKWMPKNKNARLNIEIQGDTTQFIIR